VSSSIASYLSGSRIRNGLRKEFINPFPPPKPEWSRFGAPRKPCSIHRRQRDSATCRNRTRVTGKAAEINLDVANRETPIDATIRSVYRTHIPDRSGFGSRCVAVLVSRINFQMILLAVYDKPLIFIK
jgi:hypothetical protein